MRTVLLFYFSTIILLGLSIVYIIYKGKYVGLIESKLLDKYFQTNEDQSRHDVISFQPKAIDFDCQFAFSFLRELLKEDKPIERQTAELPFQRPFTGAIRQQSNCADSMDGAEGDLVGLGPCHGQGRNQEWTFTEVKQIRSEGTGTLCLTWDEILHGKQKNLILQKCNNVNIKQKWQFDNIRKHLMPTINPRLCVTSKKMTLTLIKCDSTLKSQKWVVLMTELLNIELQVGS